MMKTNLLRYLLILHLVACTTLLKAQLPLPARPVYIHYNSYNSTLPSDLIHRVIADKHGYLWLATARGLVLFNGRAFRSFATGNAEEFVSVFRSDKDLLWLFAYSGRTVGIDLNTHKVVHTDYIHGLDRLDAPVKPYLFGMEWNDTVFLLKQNFRYMVAIDPSGKSHVEKTSSAQFARLFLQHYRLPGKVNGLDLNATLDSVLFRRNSNGLLVKNGFVIIHNMIFKLDPEGAAQLYFDGKDYGIKDAIASFVRRGDDLYFGTYGGAGFCKVSDFFTLPRSRQRLAVLLPGETITAVEEDYQHNIWVSTYGNGLFLFPYAEAATLYYDKQTSGLHQDEVTTIRKFPDGTTAVGYHDARIDLFGANGSRKGYTIPSEYRRSILHIESIARRWLAFTQSEAFTADAMRDDGWPDLFRKSPVRKGNMVVPGYKDGRMFNHNFYYTSSNNGIISVDTSGSLSAHIASTFTNAKKKALLPVSDSAFYIGTVRGIYYNTMWLPYLTEAQINSLDTVGDMLLLGTNGGGYALPRAAGLTGRGLKMLAQGPCYTIKHDADYTYLYSNDEIILLRNSSLLEVARFPFKKYAIPFRLNDFCSDGSYLVLASNRGVFYIPKAGLLHPDIEPRMHLLCSLSGYAPAGQGYKGKYREGFTAMFGIDILGYSSREKEISYRLLKDGVEIYRQDGLQDGGQINFQPSGPGDYRVEYVVRWNHGQNRRVLAYHLTLTPLWYQQWWCLPLLMLILSLLFLYGTRQWYTYKARSDRRKLEEKMYLQELESQSLFGQLKPHFIFNLLTPLQGYFIREEKMNGLNYLNNFSQLMRGILNGIRDKYSTLQHEIDFIQQYLSIQQERFDHSFEYDIQVDPAIDANQYIVPTLLFQPVVENAIEHGIDKSAAGGSIHIRVSEAERALVITITDNGAGLPADFTLKENHALKIISERIALLEKMQGTGGFTIAANAGQQRGTTVTFILAKEYTAPATS